MATVNAGRVELDLVAVARDQVTATLREVNKSLLQTKATAEGTASGTRNLRGSIEGLTGGVKEGIKPLNMMREGFEQVRSNGLFVISAITGIGAALGGLIKHLTEAGTAQGELNARAKDFEGATTALKAGIEALQEKLGKTPDATRKAWDAAIVGASEARLKVQLTSEALGEAAVKASLLRLEYEGYFKDRVNEEVLGRNIAQEVERAEKRVVDLANERRKLSGDIAEFERLSLEYIRQQNIEVGKQLLGRVVPGVGLAISVGAEKFAGQKPDPKTVGGMTAGQVEAAWLERVRRFSREEPSEGDIRRLMRRIRREGGGDEIDAAEESRREMAEALRLDYEDRTEAAERERVRIRALADEYARFADILRDGFDAALPGLGTAVTSLGELAGQMESVDDANQRAAMGVSGSIQAVTELAAANAETAQEAFIYKGLGEAAAALGSAAVGDVKGAALHTASAVAYGVAAAAAGGGGGGGAPSAGASGASPSSLDTGGSRGSGGTSVTNVYVAPGTDPQAVARALRRTNYASRGTGRGNPGV